MSLKFWILLSTWPFARVFPFLYSFHLPLPVLLLHLIFVFLQKFPQEGLANVVSNVFDFDSYNRDMREVLYEVLHKYGIPVGAKPTSVKLAKE